MPSQVEIAYFQGNTLRRHSPKVPPKRIALEICKANLQGPVKMCGATAQANDTALTKTASQSGPLKRPRREPIHAECPGRLPRKYYAARLHGGVVFWSGLLQKILKFGKMCYSKFWMNGPFKVPLLPGKRWNFYYITKARKTVWYCKPDSFGALKGAFWGSRMGTERETRAGKRKEMK